MQKLSIIRFKPKSECFDEFAKNLTSFNERKHRIFHLMRSGDELHAIVIRDASLMISGLVDSTIQIFIFS